ncbi:MAG TPA: TetR/AcrR family transcriptional regulator [Polyangiaceae bacterium]|nr:TetR/AcrR family transcriptional regulator [Polyangiaceae bacterium]
MRSTAQKRRVSARARREGPGSYDRQASSEQRRAEQRARLLAAANAVFARDGYARASVDAIVERARMSRRTFYEHFNDISDIFLHVYDQAASVLLRVVDSAIRQKKDPVEKLEAGVVAYLQTFQQNADIARVIHREIRAAGPAHALRHELAVMRFASLLSEGVVEAYARGSATRAPTETTVYALVAGLEAVGVRYVDRGEESRIMEAAPELIELVLRAFR